VSLKVVVCAAAGLFILMTGCGSTTAPENAQSLPGPTKIQPTVTPSANNQVVLVSTTVVDSAAPAIPIMPTTTPLLEAMPIPTPLSPLFTYHTIEEGESLSYIASLYNTGIEELVTMNKLSGSEAMIHTGQSLRIPLNVDQKAPATKLLPDSEVVYGPSYVGFNIKAFIEGKGGYLAGYTEYVDNKLLTGPEIVERVAEQFSVGPRVLLALLEHYSGWVTNPTPSELNQMVGPHNPRGGSLYLALGWTANRINAGYYGYKRNGFWVFTLADRTQIVTPAGVNAGTVGLQNILALHSDLAEWPKALGPAGVLADYQALFGNPMPHSVEPLVPKSLVQPALTLPWPPGQGFYLTSGPHPAYADGSAWAALDFGPPDVLGNCYYSEVPNTAAAAGVAVVARHGVVELDLDGDGHIQTGWVLQYLHVVLDSDQPVQAGQRLAAGDVVGYASCEGGLANSSHLHFSRRYNGEWIEASGPVPFDLAGWVSQPTLTAYEGTLKKEDRLLEACECWEAEKNFIVNAEAN
jgi:murein DD-endopeptidase MepM/ murein hydrolase activator NlpD